jgi:peptidoglycan/xylan/chitin deacetylase (PgdA/CDA1 family)
MPLSVSKLLMAIPLMLVLLLVALSQSLWAGEATIFIYHRFADSRYPSTNVAGDVFAAQLEVLDREHYTVLSLGQVVERLVANQELPDKCAVLTVDDAFSSFVESGWPLIQHFGYPVTLFVNTASAGQSGYLNWEQLRALEQQGVEIGSHGNQHLHLATPDAGESMVAWEHKVRAELARSNAEFQRELGHMPKLFAYPYGEFSPALIALVKAAGYQAAVAQQSGVASRFSNQYIVPRFPMGGPYATLQGFVDKLHMHAMPLRVIQPQSPIIDAQSPPVLEVLFPEPGQLDLGRLNCFVNGRPDCEVKRLAGPDVRYRVVATNPLSARRSKYTLTAPGRNGEWYWFSQLWLNPDVAEGY